MREDGGVRAGYHRTIRRVGNSSHSKSSRVYIGGFTTSWIRSSSSAYPGFSISGERVELLSGYSFNRGSPACDFTGREDRNSS